MSEIICKGTMMLQTNCGKCSKCYEESQSQLAALREEMAHKVVLAIRDVCELDPEDSDNPECICVKASDLGAILSRHFEGVE